MTIWLGEDTKEGGEVLLKVMPPALAADPVEASAFLSALLPYRGLKHEHIVPMLDVIKDAGLITVVYPDILGKTASQMLEERAGKPFNHTEIKKWISQLCEALQHAHEKTHLAHQDLQTGRLIIDEKGKLLVADFGLARIMADWGARNGWEPSLHELSYRSPQSLGGLAGCADDIYSLGVIIYELLTGHMPFSGQNLQRQVKEVMPTALNAARSAAEGVTPAPARWEATVAKCLEKTPEKRPRSPRDVAGGLGLIAGEVQAASAKKSSKDWMLYAGAGLTFALFAAGLALWYFLVLVPDRKAQAAEAARIEEERRKAQEAEVQRLQAEMEAARSAKEAAAAEERMREEEARRVKEEADRLARARGSVRIATNPPGATVTVAGVSATTPADLAGVPIGPQTMVVELPGFHPVRQEVVVKDSALVDAGVVELKRQTGGLTIVSTPPGAAVYQQGKRLGVTPLVLKDLPTGKQIFELHYPGFYSVVIDGQVVYGRDAQISAQLAMAPGPRPGANFTNDRRMAMVWVPPLNGWAGRTEVTQEQFLEVMGSNPSAFPGARRPVDSVSWREADEFCRRLTAAGRSKGAIPPNLTYRLPTELEWEALAADARMPAARTGTGGKVQAGTHEAGQGPPNRFGLHDVRGNLWEWCADPYQGNPALRVLRGGSWMNHGQGASAPDRDFNGIDDRGNHRGFRCILKYDIPD